MLTLHLVSRHLAYVCIEYLIDIISNSCMVCSVCAYIICSWRNYRPWIYWPQPLCSSSHYHRHDGCFLAWGKQNTFKAPLSCVVVLLISSLVYAYSLPIAMHDNCLCFKLSERTHVSTLYHTCTLILKLIFFIYFCTIFSLPAFQNVNFLGLIIIRSCIFLLA